VHRCCFILVLLLGLTFANVASGELAVGATRDEVEAAYGKPKGTTQIGTREILSYAEGRVYLDQGHLVKSDFADGVAPNGDAMPTSAGNAPAETTTHRATTTVTSSARDGWYTDFDAARAAAKEQHKNVLALFTGSDWCPPCMEFERTVAHNPRFLQAAQEKFVLVFLDYPHSKPQPEAVRQKNDALARRYNIEGFPTLLAIGADGTKIKLVSLGLPASGELVQSMITLVEQASPAAVTKSRIQLFALFGAGLVAFIWWLKK
jgi:thiol-disulfide isomerase/thioredoxin